MQLRNVFIVTITFFLWSAQLAFTQRNKDYIPLSIQQTASEKPDCDTLILLTENNIRKITSPFQLTFLNKIPQTRLDSLVNKIINLEPHDFANNFVDAPNLFDSIGQLRTQDAYDFLYVLSEQYFEGSYDVPIKNGSLGAGYSFEVLNKYFFNNAKSYETSQNFIWDVRGMYGKNPPTIYYCIAEDPEKKYIRLSSEIDTKTFDDDIIKIIDKHSDLRKFGGILGDRDALKEILKEVRNLDFIEDAEIDFCATKISLYPGTSTLGVQFFVGDYPIEKCYDIQVGDYFPRKRLFKRRNKTVKNIDKLIFKKSYFQRGFIELQRELCDPIISQEDLWKVSYDEARDIIFKDTINDFVLDSSFHDLGLISKSDFSVVKYFKYIGNDTVSISNINDDPHFITFYNQTTLLKDQVYQYTSIFHLEQNQGNFSSEMGFQIWNGEKVFIKFVGEFVP